MSMCAWIDRLPWILWIAMVKYTFGSFRSAAKRLNAKRITRVHVARPKRVRGWRVYPLWCTHVAIIEWSVGEHKHSNCIPWLIRILVSPLSLLFYITLYLLSSPPLPFRLPRLPRLGCSAPSFCTSFVAEILLPEV